MRLKSPEKRGRQKVARPTIYRIENEYNPEAMPQYFQISVNVLEGRKLVWANPHLSNSYVIIVLDKKKHRTSMRRNMRDPHYRESFVFELFTTVNDLQQTTLWLAVMEPRCCAPPRLLGEASIGLGAIWFQPHHQAFHKWAQLFLPSDWAAGPVGFLQVDVSILFRSEVQNIPPVIRDNKLEDNLLHSDAQQQCAMYVVTVHGAFGLPNGTQCQSDKRFGKPPNTFVKVSFCGLGAKTGVVHRNNNPMYNEQVSIVEMFPNMCQAIRFEVCSAESCFHRVLSCTQLRLDLISHDGENGFLPTFGPSMIQMYGTTCGGSMNVTGEEGPYHRGALVVSLNTKVPYCQQSIRSITVEPIQSINFENIWSSEDFCIFCPIFEVSMLDTKVAGKFCGIAITCGEIPSDNKSSEEFISIHTEIRSRKLHYTGVLEVIKNEHYGYIEFCNSYPVLQFAARLPDFRYRIYRNNIIHGIFNKLEHSLNEVERKLRNFDYCYPSPLVDELNKTIDDTAGSILKFIDIVQSTSAPSNNNTVTQYYTELYRKQIELQKEEIEKIYQQIKRNIKYESTGNVHIQETRNATSSRKVVKILLAKAQSVALHLKGLIHKNLDGWPDIVVWLLNNGSRVAFTKISLADVIYSVIPEQSGTYNGRIQTVYLKPLKCPKHVNSSAPACYCVVGKIELLVWVGLYHQRTAFDSCLHSGYKLKVKECDMCIKCNAMMVECRAFIYKAKLASVSNGTNSMQLFVRINTMNSLKETEMKCKTLSPVWNQVVKMNRMIFTSPERLVDNPPIVLIQVNNNDPSGKTELIGRIEIHPTVSYNQDYQFAPKLQWYDLFRGMEFAGQILMSVQLLQIPEKLLKNTIYSPVEEVFVPNTTAGADVLCNEVEPLPINLLPRSTSYKVDVYWWGLRDIDATRRPCVVMEIEDLSIKSEIITDNKPNCNFPNGRTTVTFEAFLNEAYCPPLSIKLFDSSTFGRSLYLGTSVVKNLNKYRIEWLPEEEREASMKRVSIMSSEFIQMNQILFIKKSSQFLGEDNYSSKSSIKSLCTSKTGHRKWYNLFSNKEPDEEKYTLLPIFTKKTENDSAAAILSSQQKDWWLKYLGSLKNYNDGDNIIDADEKMVIYENELESQPEFSKFKDWCATLKLYNGKKTDIPDKDEKLYCGFLKAGLAIYKWPPPVNTIAVTPSGVDLNRGFFDDYPSNEPAKFLIRVYIIKGLDLKTKDFAGKSDPYVLLSCGNKNIGNRNSYVPNSVNPIFGKMYEYRCCLPEDYLLAVSLYNFVTSSADELIGTTTIDLEDRIYTKHRARVGLSSEYSPNEPIKWRDCVKPSGILEQLCSRNHLPPPDFINSTTLIVNGVEYRNNERAALRKEKLCLNILNKWHTLPICGYHLVPEHVETRNLYNPNKPGIEQGKIQLWVDIFPLNTGLCVPPPVNITPRKIENYELIITVYSVRILISELHNFGKKVSDIYVKAWIGSSDQYQDTDVHYQCFGGEANFNWRMVFHFRYQHAIRKLVSKEKGPFTEYEENIPPVLVVQLLDNEETSPNQYLGSVMLNLNSMPRGVKQEQECGLDTMSNSKKVNLFTAKCMRSWWPLSTIDYNSGEVSLVGKIDLELTLMTLEKAILMPVGVGREPPFPLPEPVRPEINFDGFSNRIKSVKIMCCERKCLLVYFVCALFLIIFFTVIYFQLPIIILDYFDMM